MIKRIKRTVPPLTVAILFYGFALKDVRMLKDSYSTKNSNLFYSVPTLEELLREEEDFVSPNLGKSYLGFREALGFKESGGRYSIVNQFGYMGKYQFGKNTLRMIGIRDANAFLKSPELQEKAFYANSSRNKWILRKFITYFAGMRIKGVTVTESGILAAAHLVGPGAVKEYLRSNGNIVAQDAFNTSVVDYMYKFSGYDTSFVYPERSAKASL